MLQISKRKTTLCLAILCLSLTACAPKQTPPTAAVASKTKVQIQAQLKPLCGTPTSWTPQQKRQVADFMTKYASELGLQFLASEWDRLNAGAQLCRGGAP